MATEIQVVQSLAEIRSHYFDFKRDRDGGAAFEPDPLDWGVNDLGSVNIQIEYEVA